MTLFKINKNNDFTVMSNYHLRDKNLSLKAKGMLSFMLSLPDDWDYSLIFNEILSISENCSQLVIKLSRKLTQSLAIFNSELENDKDIKKQKIFHYGINDLIFCISNIYYIVYMSSNNICTIR